MPAPMPMVGTESAAVTAAAMGAGTHSRTMLKQPAPCGACGRATKTRTEQRAGAWASMRQPTHPRCRGRSTTFSERNQTTAGINDVHSSHEYMRSRQRRSRSKPSTTGKSSRLP
eukprot:365666-Chlamydomonas_euryale.AAC.3